eukprot:gene12005-14032_t
MNENISVVVRARPFNSEEIKNGYYEAWSISEATNTIVSLPPPTTTTTTTQTSGMSSASSTLRTPVKTASSSMSGSMSGRPVTSTFGTPKTPARVPSSSSSAPPPTTPLSSSGKFLSNSYTYDHLFPSAISNTEIYDTVARKIVWGTMEGYNAVVCAYGMTASGKTYTMKGTGKKNPGIIPLAIQDVFTYIQQTPDREFLLRFMNIQTLVVESKEAGVESGGSTPVREGAFINKSLLTLGSVISKLSEKQTGHINYRDSKLTRILQNSLSGNSRIAIICTVTLASNNMEETHSTLKFASRAKKITNNAKINEILDDKTLIKQYRSEIAELKLKLQEAMKKESEIDGVERNKDLEKRLEDAEKHRNLLESKIEHLSKLILVSSSIRNVKKTGFSSPSDPSPAPEIDPNHLSSTLKNSLALDEREIQLKSRIAKLEMELEQKINETNWNNTNNNNTNDITKNDNYNNVDDDTYNSEIKGNGREMQDKG